MWSDVLEVTVVVLLSDEFRKGDAARPVGEGKYAIEDIKTVKNLHIF
jgi:hypothetical protein